MSDVLQILDEQEKALEALYASNKRLLSLARTQQKELEARTAEDIEWIRLPGKGLRCKISNWSRRHLEKLQKAEKVRKRRTTDGSFYSGADVRRLIQGD